MGRKALPVPSKKDLQKFATRKDIEVVYDVSSYTVIGWLKQRNLYQPMENFGPRKLEKDVDHIRGEWQSGISIKELAAQYGVTFATISRIVHNITYRVPVKNSAIVSVIYNPQMKTL